MKEMLFAGEYSDGTEQEQGQQTLSGFASGAARINTNLRCGAESASFWAVYILKTIILPRQARDKHGENSKQEVLFAGSVLPVTLKFGIFGDLSGDGAVDQNDAMIWMRRQYPLADAVYRHGLIVKLDSDTTSYVQGEGKKRISFHETLSIVKQLRCVSKRSLVSFLLNFAQLCSTLL
jgi:hypothetical protein